MQIDTATNAYILHDLALILAGTAAPQQKQICRNRYREGVVELSD